MLRDPYFVIDLGRALAGSLLLGAIGGMFSALVRARLEDAWRRTSTRATARIAEPRERH